MIGPIALVERLVGRAVARSARVAAANGPEPEKTWINHALITVILGGGLGSVCGLLLGAPAFGFRVGLLVALLAYLYREVNQWRGRRDKPQGWYFDAYMDLLVPCWIASPFLLGASGFYVLTLCVAAMHFGARPVE